MTDPEANLKANLRAHNLSLTTSRLTVLNALLTHKPQTISELIANCPTINRASVYRTVDLFEKLGICQRVRFGWKYKLELSDKFQAHHHHMTCTECGISTEVPEDTTLERRLHELATLQGFTPIDHQIEIRGMCARCAHNAQ